MCELLIRVTDKINSDTKANYQATKRGDVIVVVEDGWKWSEKEQKNPDWRIVKLPGVPVEALEYLTHSELDMYQTGAEKEATVQKRTLLKRVRKLNLDVATLPKAIQNYLADSSRVAPTLTIDTSKFNIESIKVDKALVADI